MKSASTMRQVTTLLLTFCIVAFGSSSKASEKLKALFYIQSDILRQQDPATILSAKTVAFDVSPDGQQIAVQIVGHERGREVAWVGLWSIEEQKLILYKEIEEWKPESPEHSLSRGPYSFDIRYALNGKHLIVLCGRSLLRLDASTLERLQTIEAPASRSNPPHEQFIRDFSISSDGNLIGILFVHKRNSSRSVKIKLVDYQSFELLNSWTVEGPITQIALSPDGERILASYFSSLILTPRVPKSVSNLLLMDSRTGTLIRKFSTDYWIDSLQFLPDGRHFTTSPANVWDWKRYHLDTVKIWDSETGEIVREYGYKKEGVRGKIALASASKQLFAISAKTSKWSVMFDLDPPRISHRLLVWDQEQEKPIFALKNLNKYTVKNAPKRTFNLYYHLIRTSENGRIIAVGRQRIQVFRLSLDN